MVEDGRAAVDRVHAAAAAGKPFDLVVMDMQMPIMDGYSAVAELRATGHRGPIMALTADAMSGSRERCLEIGCDDFAVKPIQRIRLLRQVASLVHRPVAK